MLQATLGYICPLLPPSPFGRKRNRHFLPAGQLFRVRVIASRVSTSAYACRLLAETFLDLPVKGLCCCACFDLVACVPVDTCCLPGYCAARECGVRLRLGS